MAKKSLNGVLQRVRMLAAVQTDRALSDPELLRRLVEDNDEAAFTVLIERHGPMVLGVCQRALRHTQDAEDAFQATFLVFARKASSIRKSTSLGSWLHGIACRVCANLKRQQARRQKRERQAAVPSTNGKPVENWHEVQAVLDEELDLLPDRYRAPLLLCYWQGKTRDEAAAELGLSTGKLHGLLERGRSMLRDRLKERGLTLSAALCASFVAAGAANAAVAPTLVVSCTKAALLIGAGEPIAAGLVSTEVLILTKEVLQTMFVTKLKIAAASILCVGLAATCIVGILATTSQAQTPGATPQSIEVTVRKTESDEAFIRRISKDLRGIEPTPAEIHFFVNSKDAGRRQKLIDLFIQERQAKQDADARAQREQLDYRRAVSVLALRELERTKQKADSKDKAKAPSADSIEARRQQLEAELKRLEAELQLLKKKGAANPPAQANDLLAELALKLEVEKQYNLEIAKQNHEEQARQKAIQDGIRFLAKAQQSPGVVGLQNSFLRSLIGAAKDKKDATAITQDYLSGLTKYIQDHPKADDAPDAMLQIVLVYRALGKTVEANAWGQKLRELHPNTPAAKQRSSLDTPQFRITTATLDAEEVAIYFMMGTTPKDAPPQKK